MLSFIITGMIYIFLIILSFIMYSFLNIDFLKGWGIMIGIFILVALLPLNKMLFFSTRANHPEIIPDEHLYYNTGIKEEFDKKDKDNKKNQFYFDSLIYSGFCVIVVGVIINFI